VVENFKGIAAWKGGNHDPQIEIGPIPLVFPVD
jgi:hypothetical protein